MPLTDIFEFVEKHEEQSAQIADDRPALVSPPRASCSGGTTARDAAARCFLRSPLHYAAGESFQLLMAYMESATEDDVYVFTSVLALSSPYVRGRGLHGEGARLVAAARFLQKQWSSEAACV